MTKLKLNIDLTDQNIKIVKYIVLVFDPVLRREVELFFDNKESMDSYVLYLTNQKYKDIKIYRVKYKIEQLTQQELSNEFGQNSFDPFRL